MLEGTEIKKTLSWLDRQYIAASAKRRISNIELQLYSKLALLELSGWLEQSFDRIVMEYLERTCGDPTYIKKCKDMLIKKVNGFNYETDVQKLLLFIIGPQKFRILENKLKTKGLFDQFHSTLNTLCELRNKAAHTHTRGTTEQFSAPSQILLYYNQITKPMQYIDRSTHRMS